MKKMLVNGSVAALWTLAVVPVAVAAHEGHAGDHGWLWGALQPLLSLDHLMAGLLVVAVGAVAFASLGRASATTECVAPERDPRR